MQLILVMVPKFTKKNDPERVKTWVVFMPYTDHFLLQFFFCSVGLFWNLTIPYHNSFKYRPIVHYATGDLFYGEQTKVVLQFNIIYTNIELVLKSQSACCRKHSLMTSF